MTRPPRRDILVVLCGALAVIGCGGSGGGAGGNAGSGGVGGSGPDPFGDYGVYLSVVPPGSADANSGNINDDPNSINQLVMYENLAFSDDFPTPGQLEDDDLAPDYFKDESLLPESAFDSVRTITDGTHTARIGRDDFGVPHIFGDTREDVMFGTGYATATDRMFLIDALRHFGRGRLSDFVGPSGGNYSSDRSLAKFGGYSEEEIQAQIDQVGVRFGVDGQQAQEDLDDFVGGINQYIDDVENGAPGAEAVPVEYGLLNIELRPFTGRDVLAVAALVQSQFATGGGGEERQVRLLNGLATLFPDDAPTACQLWRDLRQADDPERPNTTDMRFETQSPPTIDETACPLDAGFAAAFPGAVMFDPDSLEQLDVLVIEDCVAPGETMPGDVECPNFREDVVGDMSTMADATASPESSLLMSTNGALASVEGLLAGLREGSLPTAMSNAILAGADQTESGHPIAVFGPQTGYFSPQALVEFSQQGGGIHSRGMAFAGLPYVIIGRGIDHAWSATSSGDDITDVRVLRLCEPGGGAATRASAHYLYEGVCTPMLQRTDEWTAETNITTGGTPNQKVTRNILRAEDYGPVFATATVAGEAVALAVQRSTFFGEVDSVAPFLAIGRNEMTDPNAFFETFNGLTGTFNWFYVDSENIAYFNSGLLPIRAAGIHPDLPQWGTGEYDWQQTATGRINADFTFDNFLPLESHPRESNPASGFFANWNNAQAPGFYANDTQTGYGALYRSQLLERRLLSFRTQEGSPLHTRASMVETMIDAGTTDLRGQEILPRAFEVLGDVSDLSSFEQEVVQLMKDWVIHGPRELGAMRRDRDGPGLDTESLLYEDHAAVAFMDGWWNNMIDEVLPQITAVEALGVMVGGRHNAPGGNGSAFQGGYYGYMRRVLDMALGQSSAPFQQLRCAETGVLADCRAALVTSLQRTVADLGTDMSAWDPTLESDDAIDHSALGLADAPNIHWQNRPTWQQVIQPSVDVLQ